jgi:hypothetical protein
MAPRPKEHPTPLPAMRPPRTPLPETLVAADEGPNAPTEQEPREPEPEPAPPPPSAPDPIEPWRARVDELEDTVKHLRAALEGALEGTTRLRRAWLEQSEPELVRLAVAIARRVVARELAMDPSLLMSWAREALGSVVGPSPHVALGAEVAQRVDVQAWRAALEDVSIEIDPGLPASAVEVRAGDARVRCCGEARVRAVAGSLGIEGLVDGSEAK